MGLHLQRDGLRIDVRRGQGETGELPGIKVTLPSEFTVRRSAWRGEPEIVTDRWRRYRRRETAG